jgi:hypothetical protein
MLKEAMGSAFGHEGANHGMASVTGNVAGEYWDDFGIVGTRSQLLKHRTITLSDPGCECNRLFSTLIRKP